MLLRERRRILDRGRGFKWGEVGEVSEVMRREQEREKGVQFISARFGSGRSNNRFEEFDMCGFVRCYLFKATSDEGCETCFLEGVCVVLGEEGGVETG
jgi:hypothetical protein